MISLDTLREKGISLMDSLRYQVIKDSPTIKYYTDWKKFEDFQLPLGKLSKVIEPLILPKQVNLLVAGSELHSNYTDAVRVSETERLANVEIKSKIDAIHYASIIKAMDIHFNSGTYHEPFKITVESVFGHKIHEGYHVRIFIDDNTYLKLELFELPLSKASSYNSIIELFVGKHSNVDLMHVVIPNNHTPSYSNLKIVVQENSKLRIDSLYTAGQMHRQQINALLIDNGSKLKINASLVGDGENMIDYVLDAVAKGVNNEILFNGLALAEDDSYVSMRAIGRIHSSSKNALVDITGYTYNIGDNARAIGSPVLEINGNNVKLARHSVGISNISQDILFYLMSRGLSLMDIKRIFRSELISRVTANADETIIKDVSEVLGILLDAEVTSLL